MKTAIRQAILSTGGQVNPSPNSLFNTNVANWNLKAGVSVSSDGVISEDSANNLHAVYHQTPYFILLNNIPYRWRLWVRPLNRRFFYTTIAPSGGTTRFVALWGLDGQGVIDTKTIGSNPVDVSTGYRKIASDVYQVDLFFRLTTGGNLQIPVIGLSNSATPTYSAFFDIPFQGLNQPSIQVLANECVPS